MKSFMLIFGFISLLLAGCSDFLEEKSQDEVIPTTATDYSEMVLAYMDCRGYAILNVLDDDVAINEAVLGSDENTTVLQNWGGFTWQPDMWEQSNSLTDAYELSYAQIMGLNAVLDNIDESVGTIEEKDVVKAEALGLRGYYYLMLVNLYGEPYNYNKEALGVPLKLSAALMENGIGRSSVEEVYEQIVDDLETASALFGKYEKRRGGFRINGPTVDILLSRVYLYMERWDEVIKAANRAIEAGDGLTDYTAIETGSAFYLPSYDLSEVEWVYDYNTIPTVFGPSSDLLSEFSDGDKRKEFWFDPYGGIAKKNMEGGFGPTQTVRISEAYLNRAEACLFADEVDVSIALADLNELRRHRIVGYDDIEINDRETLLQEIKKERRLELCYDGHRWFDLRRWGMPSISHAYKTRISDAWVMYVLREKDPLYTLPISQEMIKNNIKLEQNASAYEAERTGISE